MGVAGVGDGCGRALQPEIGVLTDWANTADVITDLLARRIRGNAVLEAPA